MHRLLLILFRSDLPDNADVMAARMTDRMTEGPVMWQAAWPTTRNTDSAQKPDSPVDQSRRTSSQVIWRICSTHRGFDLFCSTANDLVRNIFCPRLLKVFIVGGAIFFAVSCFFLQSLYLQCFFLSHDQIKTLLKSLKLFCFNLFSSSFSMEASIKQLRHNVLFSFASAVAPVRQE